MRVVPRDAPVTIKARTRVGISPVCGMGRGLRAGRPARTCASSVRPWAVAVGPALPATVARRGVDRGRRRLRQAHGPRGDTTHSVAPVSPLGSNLNLRLSARLSARTQVTSVELCDRAWQRHSSGTRAPGPSLARRPSSTIKPVDLALDDLVEDGIERRVRLANRALSGAHALQPVRGDECVYACSHLAGRHGRSPHRRRRGL